MSEAKPFSIDRHLVWESWLEVRANHGAAGVDEQSIMDFERNLKANLYKIWNRMSSGSYFPPPVRRVVIPKSGGGERKLGIPTVADRVAQMVAKRVLEPLVEPHFHRDSYGYRPGKSAHQAVATARERCWRHAWVLDLDIRGFFDNIDHELMMKAVLRHGPPAWVSLYVERWLKAPVLCEDGTLEAREKGTPQGGVISPLLANLFLHYALDEWLRRNWPRLGFERYADDMIVHCGSLPEAQQLRHDIEARLGQCGLELHPDKTKIVYCKGSGHRGSHEHEKFDFLGFEFRARLVRNQQGQLFVGFNPAISPKATQEIREEMRRWKLHRHTQHTLEDMARRYNPVLSGWINYYGRFHRSALCKVLEPLQDALRRWAMRKYKRLRRHPLRAWRWLHGIIRRQPALLAHWNLFLRRNDSMMGAG